MHYFSNKKFLGKAKDLFLHIEQEQKHILCNIAEFNKASLHNPKSVIRKTALYMTISYLINLFR